MTPGRATSRAWNGLLLALAGGLVALVVGGAPASAATTPPAGPTPSSPTEATPFPGGPTSSSDQATPAPGGTGPAASPAPEPDVGGVLFVSGVRTGYRPDWNPLAGTLHLEITVRNATDQVLDASVSYGATTLLGIDLGGSSSLAVRGLAPGEVRVVGADVPGVGQWGVVRAHMTVRPPAQFRGVDLSPLERDRWVVVPAWYLAGLVVLAVVVALALRRFPLRRAPEVRVRVRRAATGRPRTAGRWQLPRRARAPQSAVTR